MFGTYIVCVIFFGIWTAGAMLTVPFFLNKVFGVSHASTTRVIAAILTGLTLMMGALAFTSANRLEWEEQGMLTLGVATVAVVCWCVSRLLAHSPAPKELPDDGTGLSHAES